MEERVFDEAVEKAISRNINQIYHYDEPSQMFTMTPMQAAWIEKELNMNKQEDIMGYLLLPVRREDQTLYKAGMAEEEAKTFAQEQEQMLVQFYKNIDTVKNKISSQQFHCFLTLQQLRRHHLARYFMSSPDPLFLKLYNYREIIGQFLDIRQIASKLLKRKYRSKEDFQVDMVGMIQNFRIYFLKDQEMLDISIKFEALFWDIYTNEEKANKQAMETFKYYKQRCKIARNFKNRSEKFTHQQKKELVAHFNSLTPEAKKKILFCLEVGPLKNQKILPNGPIDLSKMKNNFFVELDSLLKKQKKEASKTKKEVAQKAREARKKDGKKDVQRMKQQKMGLQNEIYFSDEEQEDEDVDRKHNQEVSRKAIQEVMDLINMQEAILGSDDDD